MAKTSKPITTSITTRKTAATKSAAGKAARKAKAVITNGNGTAFGRMSEKTKQMTLRAFQMAYDEHHPEEAAAEAKSTKPAKRNRTSPKLKKKIVAGAALPALHGGDNFPSREDPAVLDPTLDSEELIKLMRRKLPAAAPVKLSEETRQATLRSFQMAYESHNRKEKE